GGTLVARRGADRAIDAQSPLEQLTVGDAAVGTPSYMAPELYRGEGASAATDQFAFGITLYEALFGTRPYAREDLAGSTAVDPKPHKDISAPARIERAVLRAIALDPQARFATMDLLLGELAF